MEANPINACHLAIDDNVFLLNYNKAVVVRNGIAYTNTRTRVRRLVRYSSSEDLQDEMLGTSVDESLKPHRLLSDVSESIVENKGFRLHWLCSLHCEDIFIPCRVSGLHFPYSKMGQMLQLQYLIDCKPDDLYTDSFTKALEYSITRLLMQEVQFTEFTLIPGYSIQLNWLTPRIKKLILTKIERILCFQTILQIASFEYQRLNTFEAIRLLLSLAQSAGTTLKELFLWYFFKANSCPLIGQHSTDEEKKLNPIHMPDRDTLSKNKTTFSFQIGEPIKKDSKNSLMSNKSKSIIKKKDFEELRKEERVSNETEKSILSDMDNATLSEWIENWIMDASLKRGGVKQDSINSLISNKSKSIIKKKDSEELKKEEKVINETEKSILPDMDNAPLSTWIENWIMDECGKIIDEKIRSIDVSNSTIQCGSSASEAHTVLTIDSHSSHRTYPDGSDNQKPWPVVQDIFSSISSSKDSTNVVARDGKLRLDKSSVTFEELFNRFHSTSELDLLTEIKRRVTQPVKGRSKKIKPAKLRSLALCVCYEKDFGLDKVCSLCQRNAKEDLTYSAFDKLELEQEIHQLLYFPLDDERVYFLDDENKCFQNCHDYIASDSKRNMREPSIRMVYKIALSAFTCLTRLSINYNYLADGSGETLLCIGAIRKGNLTDLEILCTKYDVPSNSKQPHTYSTRRLFIPNLVWTKIRCLCPQLRLHLVLFGISKYNSASSFLSKDMPLTSLHISTGNNVTPVNLLKPGEKLDLWNFDQLLKSMGMYHDSLVSLTLELWLLPYKTDDTLVKLLMKLKHLERFRYRGPIQSLQTINRICDFYLQNENIIELKIWKIQEPLLRPEADVEAIKCKEKMYKSAFVNRDVDFALGSFPF